LGLQRRGLFLVGSLAVRFQRVVELVARGPDVLDELHHLPICVGKPLRLPALKRCGIRLVAAEGLRPVAAIQHRVEPPVEQPVDGVEGRRRLTLGPGERPDQISVRRAQGGAVAAVVFHRVACALVGHAVTGIRQPLELLDHVFDELGEHEGMITHIMPTRSICSPLTSPLFPIWHILYTCDGSPGDVMSAPIVEVRIKPSSNRLRLEWGLTVQDHKWVWDQPKIEIRLYCRPYPDFGKPTLLDTDLDDLHTTYTSSGAFKIPFIDVTVGKEKSRGGFRPGMVAADPTGKYYPVEIDLSDVEIPAGGVICYPAVEWPVGSAWLEKPFDCWAVFGYTARGEFLPVHQVPPYEHRPEGAPSHPVLPDIPTVPYEDRVRRRGATRRLFISYRHTDIFAVNQIARRLSDEFYYDIWIDYDSVPGGARWQEEIAKGIQSADRVLFMLTPGACVSEWCQAEIAHALQHGKAVIPLRLTTEADANDLKKIGLDAHQWIDFATAYTDIAWQRLMDSLPKVTARERYYLEHPDAQRLHERYLRRFFKDTFMKLSLADMMDDPPKRGVDLVDIYVPLPVDMSVTIHVNEDDHYTIDDWWVKTERSETRADEATPEELRGQKLCEWPALRVGQDGLQILIDDVQRKLKQRAAKEGAFNAEQNWYMEAHDAASIQPRMVLTGNPGGGKSTFLKHLAICLAGDLLRRSRHVKADLETLEFWPLQAFTPVFVSLRDLVATQFPHVTDPAGTPQFEAHLKDMLHTDGLDEFWPDLQRQLDAGDVIILLDGLDEVPDAVTRERREQIMAFTNALSVDYESCRMIITSRPYAYNGDWQLEGFGQTALVPLFPSRVQQLADKLFSQVLPSQDAVETEVQGFLRYLRRIEDPELSNTPLLFTMLAALWLRNTQLPPENRLPQRLSQLYRASVDLMLRRWTRKDIVDGLSVADRLGLTPEQLRQALTATAYRVQSEHGSDRSATFSWHILVEAMEDVRGGPVEKYQAALDYLEQRAGLLTSEEARRYRFNHLSFQEHLAACYLAAPERFPADILRHIQEQPGRWTNVVPLLADEVSGRDGALVKLFERPFEKWEMTN
jgi:hypothetical protein